MPRLRAELALILSLGLSLATTAARADNWPQWRGAKARWRQQRNGLAQRVEPENR